jgi:hypothetical protein
MSWADDFTGFTHPNDAKREAVVWFYWANSCCDSLGNIHIWSIFVNFQCLREIVYTMNALFLLTVTCHSIYVEVVKITMIIYSPVIFLWGFRLCYCAIVNSIYGQDINLRLPTCLKGHDYSAIIYIYFYERVSEKSIIQLQWSFDDKSNQWKSEKKSIYDDFIWK